MSYTPPSGSAANVEFGATYSAPSGSAATIDFDNTGARQIYPSGFDAGATGTPTVAKVSLTIAPVGFDSLAPGVSDVSGVSRSVFPSGVDTAAAGTPSIGRFIKPTGFNALQISSATNIYLKQRWVTPAGVDSFSADPDWFGEEAWFHVGYLTGTLAPAGVDTAASSVFDISHKNRRIYQNPADPAQPPSFSVKRAFTPTGVQGAAYGTARIDAVEVNVLKMRGDDGAQFGNLTTNRSAPMSGYAATTFGTPKLTALLRVSGVQSLGFGVPSLVYTDGTDFVCGSFPRAISVPGSSYMAMGNMVVSR